MKTIAGLHDLPPFSTRVRLPPPHPEPDLHLLTQTSTSSPRARPPPPVRSPPEQLKGEAERLGTGGLWCQDEPETEAGDQGPAAPDQRVTITKLISNTKILGRLDQESMAEGADGGAVLKALPGGGADGGPAWWRS
ncbi:unnamed protein product [Boreogadus saida]